jgi:hypothetical protein
MSRPARSIRPRGRSFGGLTGRYWWAPHLACRAPDMVEKDEARRPDEPC